MIRISAAGRRRLALVTAAVVAAVTAIPGAASAAGDSQLDALIVSNPVPGWVSMPASAIDQVVSSVSSFERDAANSHGLTTAVAARGWYDPSAGPSSNLLVLLVSISGDQSQSTLAGLAKTAASAGAGTFCAGATAGAPKSDDPYPPIPGSHLVQCGALPNGATPSAIAFSKGNVFGIVGTPTLDTGTLGNVAHAQLDALPDGGVHGSSSTSHTALIIGIAVGVVLIALVVIVAVTRSRSTTSPALAGATAVGPGGLPPRGWYPDPVSPRNSRYWTGTEWWPPPGETHVAPPPVSATQPAAAAPAAAPGGSPPPYAGPASVPPPTGPASMPPPTGPPVGTGPGAPPGWTPPASEPPSRSGPPSPGAPPPPPPGN